MNFQKKNNIEVKKWDVSNFERCKIPSLKY